MMVSGVVMGAAWLAPKSQSADGQSADEQSTDLAAGLNGKTHGLRSKMMVSGVVMGAAWLAPKGNRQMASRQTSSRQTWQRV